MYSFEFTWSDEAFDGSGFTVCNLGYSVRGF